MNKNRLTTILISIKNLKHRTFRTICLITLVTILSFMLFGGSILVKSLKYGLDSTAKRMGADIMVVPKGYADSLKGALLSGKPCGYYLDKDWLEKIAQVEGVNRVSSQLFLASLSESECCDEVVQLIGFDQSTDFVIQPWLSKQLKGTLQDGEIVIGNNLEKKLGDHIKFYGQDFTVAGKLEKTGMGFDGSVFMTYNTAYKLLETPNAKPYFSNSISSNVVSNIMLELKEGYSAEQVKQNILDQYGNDKKIEIVVSANIISGISNNINVFVGYISILSFLIWILVISILMIVFTITVNERKKEFGILRVLGATRKKLVSIVLTEAIIISFLGSVLGIILVSFIIFPFSTYIGTRLQIPYLQPQLGTIILTLVTSFIISFITGPMICAYSAFKIGKMEAYVAIKENE
jgi:putative ABC transport system permease protein